MRSWPLNLIIICSEVRVCFANMELMQLGPWELKDALYCWLLFRCFSNNKAFIIDQDLSSYYPSSCVMWRALLVITIFASNWRRRPAQTHSRIASQRLHSWIMTFSVSCCFNDYCFSATLQQNGIHILSCRLLEA